MDWNDWEFANRGYKAPIETYGESVIDWENATPSLDSAKAVWERVKNIIEELNLVLPKKLRVLDAGCGNGQQAIYLQDIGIEAIGIDKKVDIPFEYDFLQQGNLSKTGFPDNHFNMVLSNHIFDERYNQPRNGQPILDEINRVLTPNGLYVRNEPFAKPHYFYGGKLLYEEKSPQGDKIQVFQKP